MKIFIVDDDADMVAIMSVLLEGNGHDVRSSVAAASAIPEITSFHPDLLLTDLVMAELDGLEFCRELREGRGLTNLRIVFVSAKIDDYWHERAHEAGAVGYLEKPIDPTTFVDQVEQLARA